MTSAPLNRPSTSNAATSLALSAWCIVAAFGAYFCMYAFRKPFTAGAYSDRVIGGLDTKTLLVTAQVLGYTLSKFLGIKVVAEVSPRRRAALLLALVLAAETALLLFGLTPPPWSAVWLFCNGVPLGMVFGLVLGFLEGRRQSEALTSGLCASFIVADGVTKAAGAELLARGVSEAWMPAVAGVAFLPPLLGFTWMLTRIPQPSVADVAARSARTPMNGADRWALFLRFAPGLSLLVLVFLLVTILRSVRADFAREIWAGLHEDDPQYARSELVVAVGVLLLSSSAIFIRDNYRAFSFGMLLALGGSALIALSLLLLHFDSLSAFPFMVLVGIGLYLPYIAVHTILFERLLAMTRARGNMSYLMYLADSFGYLGYVAVLLGRNVVGEVGDFLGFFLALSGAIAVACLVFLLPCWRYFALRAVPQPALPETLATLPQAALSAEGAA